MAMFVTATIMASIASMASIGTNSYNASALCVTGCTLVRGLTFGLSLKQYY